MQKTAEGLSTPLLDGAQSQAAMPNYTPQRSIALSPGGQSIMSPTRAQSVAQQRDSRRRLLKGLWCTGVFLRMLTLGSSFALLASSSYAIYVQLPDLVEPPLHVSEYASRARVSIELALPFLSGCFLFGLEWASTCNEASARATLGLAFSAGGRLAIFLLLTLISLPAVAILTYSSLEFLGLAAAVCLLPANGLLQAWLLYCVPDFAKHTVADLNVPALSVDSSQFPQVRGARG